ncbi:DUF3343 domain-containing protein [Treponema pedis]|uniref:DUF3343 domain-containing protein n=1 Tax=Treponema pedis TaxID=409322 RepID=UPI0003F5FE75|nr:DUF3343 domain-containing protein [Treponema pedis]
MNTEVFAVFSFSSSHYAIAAELAVKGKEEARLIPLPPEISAGCGLVLRVKEDAVKNTAELLNGAEIPYEEIYKLTVENKKRIAEKYDLL